MLSSARRQAWFNPEPERVPTEDLGARRFLRDARAMELSATDPAEPVARLQTPSKRALRL